MEGTTVPRTLAAILLVVSLVMLVPLGTAVAALLRGDAVSNAAWSVPLVILATGFALMWLLSRKGIALRLFLPALALWLLAAGYFLFTR